MKRIVAVFAILVLLFLQLSKQKPAYAATCSGGELTTSNIIYPPAVRLDTPVTLSILGAPPSLASSTLYVFLWNPSTNSPALPLSVPISISSGGGGIVTLDWGTLGPGLDQGTYAIRILAATDPFSTPCSPNINVQILVEEEICVSLGDSCNYPSDNDRIEEIDFCTDVGAATCGSNGLWQSPPLSTFDYICLSQDPPTCNECEVFPDGTRNCYPAPPETQVICENTCREAPGGTAMTVSEGCGTGPGTVNTAIGCIPFNIIGESTKFFLQWSLSIGGGIGLVLIGIAGIMYATSAGNPQRLESAKSLFFAAIGGLLMLVLSVFLLRFIGVDILGLFA